MRISSSLASAPLHHLEQTLKELESAGVDYLHFDVEDGSFVPCMNLGTRLIADLRPRTKLPFDVHLMMVNPEWLLPELARMGVNRISVHHEACPYTRRVLRKISSFGIAAGLAFNPITPLPDLRYLAPHLSFLVILTTEPEVPDSSFLPEILEKVRSGKATAGLKDLEWVVDGGVGPKNVEQIARAGADTIVVGRGIFHGGNIDSNVQALRSVSAN